jgi:hypothetical protein
MPRGGAKKATAADATNAAQVRHFVGTTFLFGLFNFTLISSSNLHHQQQPSRQTLHLQSQESRRKLQ